MRTMLSYSMLSIRTSEAFNGCRSFLLQQTLFLIQLACRAYLLQDIYLEMQLDGVSPNWQTFSTALYGTMRQRLLHDCLYFFQEMQRCGFSPTVRPNPCPCCSIPIPLSPHRLFDVLQSKSYAVLINAAGRVGQFSYANKASFWPPLRSSPTCLDKTHPRHEIMLACRCWRT